VTAGSLTTAISYKPSTHGTPPPTPKDQDQQEASPPNSATGTEHEVLDAPEKKHGLWCQIKRGVSSVAQVVSGQELHKHLKKGKEVVELRETLKVCCDNYFS